jgi:putative flippase GtrA
MTKVILYALFALIATTVNLLTQWPIFRIFQGKWVLFAALTAGTLSGLFTKYYLDKKWIFQYTPSSRQDDISRFGLYSLMGVFTTVIFWCTETGFYYLFEFSGAQYVGGALGVTMGYSTKYMLDKRFVFREVG